MSEPKDYLTGNYRPRAEARAEAMIEGVIEAVGEVGTRMKERLTPVVILGETFEYMTKSFIPQGRDELANAIFNGEAYWPGNQVDMSPNIAPDQGGVYGPESAPVQIESAAMGGDLSSYIMGDYSPAKPDHNSLYSSPDHGGIHGKPSNQMSDSVAAYMGGYSRRQEEELNIEPTEGMGSHALTTSHHQGQGLNYARVRRPD